MNDSSALSDEDRLRLVAVVRVPISVTALVRLIEGVELGYGPGTQLLQQPGPWLYILEPTPEQRTRAEAAVGRLADDPDDDEEPE